MRIAVVVLLAIVAAATLWTGGELHKRNCVAEGQHGCSVLPWSGHEPECKAPTCVRIPRRVVRVR